MTRALYGVSLSQFETGTCGACANYRPRDWCYGLCMKDIRHLRSEKYMSDGGFIAPDSEPQEMLPPMVDAFWVRHCFVDYKDARL